MKRFKIPKLSLSPCTAGWPHTLFYTAEGSALSAMQLGAPHSLLYSWGGPHLLYSGGPQSLLYSWGPPQSLPMQLVVRDFKLHSWEQLRGLQSILGHILCCNQGSRVRIHKHFLWVQIADLTCHTGSMTYSSLSTKSGIHRVIVNEYK
jgi:hypothetical protein